jgi:hypothetical protein
MKKFLVRLSIFLIVTFAAQYIFYIAIKSALDKKSQFRFTRYFRSPRHKFFVVGNSRGVNSINEKYATEKLNTDIINLSFNGEPYKNAVNLIDDINTKNRNSVIFIEITCLNNNNFDNSYSYYISNSKVLQKQFSGTIYRWVDLLRLNSELLLRNIYYLKKSDNDWINGNTISQNIINHIKTDSSFKAFPDQKLFFERLAQLQKKCDISGNNLVYFLAPYYPDYLYKITDYNTIISYMSKNSEKYSFINLNDTKLSNNMFADRIHTNYRGSILLTTNLINLSKK